MEVEARLSESTEPNAEAYSRRVVVPAIITAGIVVRRWVVVIAATGVIVVGWLVVPHRRDGVGGCRRCVAGSDHLVVVRARNTGARVVIVGCRRCRGGRRRGRINDDGSR